MITVVIPAFNEEDSITRTIEELQNELNKHFTEFEIIVVNDASTDNTLTRLKSIDSIKLVSNLINMGYGYSLKRGIKLAINDIILIIDGDSSYPLNELKTMYDKYKLGFELVIASRESNFVEDSILKDILRNIFRKIIEFSSGITVPDVNSGLRFFSKSTCMSYFPWMSDRYSFTTSMTLLYALDKRMIYFFNNGFRVRVGKSKVKLGRDALRTLQIIIEIIARKNPLKIHLLVLLFTAVLVGGNILYSLLISKHFDVRLLFICSLVFSLQLSLSAIAVQMKKK